MIPTRHKARLARTQSYPLGAEAISQALESSRFAEPCGLWFSPESIRRRRGPAVYKVFEVAFHPADKPGYSAARWSIDNGFYDPRWVIAVYAVPRARRHQVNRLLLERGLPEVAMWLDSAERAGWKSRYHRIELLFNPLEEGLLTDEFTGAGVSPSNWSRSS